MICDSWLMIKNFHIVWLHCAKSWHPNITSKIANRLRSTTLWYFFPPLPFIPPLPFAMLKCVVEMDCRYLPVGSSKKQESSRKTSATAAAAKLLQSCPTLCDPRDGSPPGSSVPGILQARTLEWVAILLIYFCFIDYAKAFDCVGHKKTVENSSRDGNTRPPNLPSEKSIGRSRSNS